MRRCLAFAALLAMLSVLASTVARAWEYGANRAFAVYIEDGVRGEDLRDDVIVMFHGFRSAMPDYYFRILTPEFGDNHSVVGFNYDYTDVDRNIAEFEDFYGRFLGHRNVVFFGTSLGGFWADYFGARLGVGKVILINPAIDPQATMRRALGTNESRRRGITFEVTEKAIEAYAALELTPADGTDKLVVLTRDDSVLDYRAAEAFYEAQSHAAVRVYDEGGHSPPLDQPRFLDALKRFIDR